MSDIIFRPAYKKCRNAAEGCSKVTDISTVGKLVNNSSWESVTIHYLPSIGITLKV